MSGRLAIVLVATAIPDLEGGQHIMIKFPLLAASALILGTALAAPAHAQPSPTPTPTPPPGATGVCNDGTYCYNQDRSRACLHHGGVRQWFGSAAGQSNIGPGIDIILPGEGTERTYEVVRQAIALIVDSPADWMRSPKRSATR